MKPWDHSLSSVKKFGGQVSDYLKIHDWFDQTKAHVGDNRHRAILHNSFGIFLAEQMFGHVIANSDSKDVSVRDIGEQHVFEDLGFIPAVSDYLENLKYQSWMSNEKGSTKPSSQTSLKNEIVDSLNIMMDVSFQKQNSTTGLNLFFEEAQNPIFIPESGLKKTKSMQMITD